MQLKPFSVATAALVAASATNGFLIPPELSDIDIKIAEILEIPSPTTTDNKPLVLNLDCPFCPVHVVGADGRPTLLEAPAAPPSRLQLVFNIDRSSGSGVDRLVVNDFELYPSADPFQTLGAAQILEGEEDPRGGGILLERLGYSLQARTVGEGITDGGDGLELVVVDLQVIEVDDVFVDFVPNVRVRLVKDGKSGLVIAGIETTESQVPRKGGEGSDEECASMMCQWIKFAKEKMDKMKEKVKGGCHGMMGKVGGFKDGGHHGKMHHGGHHGHHGQDGHHDERPPHFRGPPHTWGQLFSNIGRHVLLPMLIGLVAGVSASLIGMIVGTLIVSLWRAFFRRPSQRDAVKEDASTEEKSGLIEHQDAPPAYEDEEDVKKVDV